MADPDILRRLEKLEREAAEMRRELAGLPIRQAEGGGGGSGLGTADPEDLGATPVVGDAARGSHENHEHGLSTSEASTPQGLLTNVGGKLFFNGTSRRISVTHLQALPLP